MAYVLPPLLALRPTSLIDFGCGRSALAVELGAKVGIPQVARFDPAIAEIGERPPQISDVLVTVDVLEHVPEEELDDVIADCKNLARQQLFVIDMRPAKTLLSDGRNAHVSQHDAAWWRQRLGQHFGELHGFWIGSTGRVALKTWEANLPWPQRHWVTLRERALKYLPGFA